VLEVHLLVEVVPTEVDTEVDMGEGMAVPQVGQIAVMPVLVVVLGEVPIAMLVGSDVEEEVEEVGCPTWATARVRTSRRPLTSMSDVEVILML